MLSDKQKELLKNFKVWILVGAMVLFLLGYWAGTNGGGRAPAENDHVHQETAGQLWTCSMHPQIKKPGPGACPICGMDLIPVKDHPAGELGPRQLKLTPTAVKLAEIELAEVHRRSVSGHLRMVGKVDYDETSVRRISAWIPGRIDRLFVAFTGAAVQKGQPLVSLYSPDLIVAQEELRQARLALGKEGGGASGKVADVARRTIDSVKEKLRLLGLSSRQVETLTKAAELKDHLVIPSPAGGVVIGKDAVEGMYVKAGTPIYTVADLSTVWVKMDAYEADLKWLRVGQTVQLEAEAFPGERFAGTVAFIDPVIDSTTRTAKVRVNAPNPGGKLKPEMFVKASLESSGEQDTTAPLVIPASAPLLTGTRAVVYVAVDRDNGVYEGRLVELGARAGDFYVVKSGLAEGDLVVKNGAFKIDSDLQIRGKPSMMSPEGGASSSNRQKVPEAFSASIRLLLDSYLGVQQALGGDDEAGARKQLKGFSVALGRVDMKLLRGDDHMAWMTYDKQLRDVLARINSGKTIAELRTSFSDLTDRVIETVTRFGGEMDKTLYRFHCPMALDNKGAYWLQDQANPRNPYFGSSMLICHDFKEEWKPEG